MSTWDLEFYEYSMIADDPKKLEKLKNYVYDPEYDEWLNEVEDELNGVVKEDNNGKLPDYSEYEVKDDLQDAEGDFKGENGSDEESIIQDDLEQNLAKISSEEGYYEDEFAPLYNVDEVSALELPDADDWEEVD